jgi:putative pyrroloquinoline-quinone binding quinoprotein/putative pyrroloquinoline-quinone-binding quinoprotein
LIRAKYGERLKLKKAAKIPWLQPSEKRMILRFCVGAAIVVLATASTPATTKQRVLAPIASTGIQQVAAGPSGSWTTYHHDNAHTGYDPTAPTMSAVLPTPGWTESALDGQVYAEALVHNGLVYTATLNNTVYALDQATGLIVWSNHLGTPQASGWICGNVAPMGILGTPVIDTAANRIYAVAEIAGATPTYRLFGLALGTGAIVLNAVIAPFGFDWKIQQQRGALALANGYVYVPFGGRAGDCFDGATPYYGWIVGVPTSGGTNTQYRTPSGAESVWAPGGVVVDDTSHNVFFPTGNAIPCPGSTYSDAIVRVNPTLGSPTFFEPPDWQANWCAPDSDLGSASPTLISPTLMFMAGKRGGGFLLNPTNLGGVGGQLYPPPAPAAYTQAEVCTGNHSAATYGSFAYAAPYIYLECEGLGLVALNVNTSTPAFNPCGVTCASPNWRVGGSTTFGPPIVAGGAVWVASNSGLYAFNAATGAQMYHSASFGINRFVTPSEAGGQVLVPSHTVVKSFSFGVTVRPAQLAFGGQAPGTTSAPQTVTLYNIQAATLNVATATLTGANAASYVKGTDTCTATAVPANGTCTVQVSFRPATSGSFPAALTFTDNGPGSPRDVALSGAGALDNQGHLYTLDGWGGVHTIGSAPNLSMSQYWPGWNIARSLALFPDGTGGYSMDGWGGLHPVGNANPVSASAYWPGWDIARQVVLAPWATKAAPAGWTLDGWGGIHEFGGAPAITGYAYWPGWDIARGIAILPDSTPGSVAGYTMDGWGGVHQFGGALPVNNYQWWPGWDIARGLTLTPNSTKANPAGWTLDGWGGLHPFGSAPPISNYTYWPGWDIARGVVSWTAGNGGWTMDGWGGIHAFGSAPAITSYQWWPGWDIATSLAGPGSNSGSMRRS